MNILINLIFLRYQLIVLY